MFNRTLRTLLAGSVISYVMVCGAASNLEPLSAMAKPLQWRIAQSPFESIQATSGGRMGGGGFGSDAPPSSGSSGSSGSRSSGSSSYGDGSSSYSNRRSGGGGTISLNGNFILMLIVAGMIATPAGRRTLNRYMMTFIQQAASSSTQANSTQANRENSDVRSPATGSAQSLASQPLARQRVSRQVSGEISNNIVTITQLQVAMLAQARHVQQALNQIASETDFSTQKGLTVGLRETVLALLRAPETWTHAIATSKTVNTKKEAKERFEMLSLEERSKFDVESLVNIDGEIKRRERITTDDKFASHIVVTLIIGTAHDSAIIDPVMSVEELKTALKRIGAITPEYLMVYEILWSPQNESDSLTDEELLSNYPKMFQLT
ncbi:MAG: DUF1517 domain-containing protein [Cyanobacteria bacterium J06632_3]